MQDAQQYVRVVSYSIFPANAGVGSSDVFLGHIPSKKVVR